MEMDNTHVESCQEIVQPGVLCHKCRYDLRGQSRVGRCPECGAGIEYSIAMALKPRQKDMSPWVSLIVVVFAWWVSTILHQGAVAGAGLIATLGCAIAVHDMCIRKGLKNWMRGVVLFALISGLSLLFLIAHEEWIRPPVFFYNPVF